MGNAHSDQGEQGAWNVIRTIPLLNFAYGFTRVVVYAAKGNGDEVIKTTIGIPGSILSSAAVFTAGAGVGLLASTTSGAFAAAAGTGYDLAKAASSANQEGSVSLLTSDQLRSLKEMGAAAVNTQITELRSLDGRFRFVMQGDRNIVLYKHDKSIWSSNTYTGNPCGPYKLYVQADGNLAAYKPDGSCFWDTKTYKNPGPGPFHLVMQDDGNCVLYNADHRALWATNTYKHR